MEMEEKTRGTNCMVLIKPTRQKRTGHVDCS